MPGSAYERSIQRYAEAPPEEQAQLDRQLDHTAAVLGWQFLRHWPRDQAIFAASDLTPPNETTNMVQIPRTDLWVRRWQWFTAVGGDLPYIVSMLVHFDGKETRCAEARYSERTGGPKVTSTRIRTVRLDDLLQSALTEHSWVFTRKADGRFVVTFRAADDDHHVALRAASKDGRRRTPIEDLERVALVYRSAIAVGANPTAAVEREMGLTNRNTAKKWVVRARGAGLLEPAPGERKGGLAPAKHPQGGKSTKERDK